MFMLENVYYFMFLVFLYHVEAAKNDLIRKEDVKKWDEEFMEVDLYTYLHLGMVCAIFIFLLDN